MLCRLQPGVGDACLKVAGVEQCDSDAGRVGGFEQHMTHLVRLAVWRAAAIVVQVVERTDAREPRQKKLGDWTSVMETLDVAFRVRVQEGRA